MERILSVEQMRQSDAYTIEKLGADGALTLIRRAASAVFESHSDFGKCAILCGSGNNGSDGLALALLIKRAGGNAHVFKTNEKCTREGEILLDEVKKEGIPIELCTIPELSGYDTVVDCLLGTGFTGKPEGIVRQMIGAINESDAFVISVDINSGLGGDNGLLDVCVKSDLTVSIGYFKPGHFLGSAKDVIGKLVNCNIGIEIPEYGDDKIILSSTCDYSDILPERANNSHKGTYGYVTLMGGCLQYSGAAKLANLAACAMRSGAGVVRLAVERSLADALSPYLLESTLCLMEGDDGVIRFDPCSLEKAVSGVSCVAVGMGWGVGDDYPRILEYLTSCEGLRLIIDADGLNTLARMGADVLKRSRASIAITPHPKEFSRISGFSMAEIAGDPIGCAKSFAREYGVVVLLKGASTVITDSRYTFIEGGGCAGMATAGSGDVLSGVLCAVHGYNGVSVKSVACGARICAIAGELAADEWGSVAMIASDTAANVGKAVKRLTVK